MAWKAASSETVRTDPNRRVEGFDRRYLTPALLTRV